MQRAELPSLAQKCTGVTVFSYIVFEELLWPWRFVQPVSSKPFASRDGCEWDLLKHCEHRTPDIHTNTYTPEVMETHSLTQTHANTIKIFKRNTEENLLV